MVGLRNVSKICLFLYLLFPSSAEQLSDYETTDRLVEIEQEDWIELRDMYRQGWPKKNIATYYLLNNFIGWVKKEPNLKNLYVYSLNDEWGDGTFTVIVSSEKGGRKVKAIL